MRPRPLTFALLFCCALAQAFQPCQDQGSSGLLESLHRLRTVASVLHTGAHPDDENNGMLAYLARGLYARTAYFSATRGDGGQNLIGTELYEAIGVIRTEELLAARCLDGAEQYFGHSYDFGFSKRADEALNRWGREEALSDLVRVVRKFRPQIIISRFAGEPADGHGQHQAVGILTREAFRAAADPKRFPEHMAEGLRPWQAKKLYVNPFRADDEKGLLRIDVGQYNPLLGLSFFELGMRARSLHRSQAQGGLFEKGPRWTHLKLVDSAISSGASENSMLDGLDTRLTAIAQAAKGENDKSLDLLGELKLIDKLVAAAISDFDPEAPDKIAPHLLSGLGALRALRDQVKASKLSEAAKYEITFLLERKIAEFAEAVNKALSLSLDVIADSPILVPGQTITVTMRLLNRGTVAIEPADFRLMAPNAQVRDVPPHNFKPLSYNQEQAVKFQVTARSDVVFTQPYWLISPRRGDRFQVSSTDLLNLPFQTPEIIGSVRYKALGVQCQIERPAEYRYVDAALGEQRSHLKIAPAISVLIWPEMAVIPVAGTTQRRKFTVSLLNNLKGKSEVSVRLLAPEGWSVTPRQYQVAFEREGEKRALSFEVAIPVVRRQKPGEFRVKAEAEFQGKKYNQGYHVISYPHIKAHHIYREAVCRVKTVDVVVPQGLKVGYVMGTGDAVPQALEQVGVSVKLLDASELASGDLRKYDAIVIGIRAYSVREDLRAYNWRLLDYVRGGGTLIVQYQHPDFVEGNFAPYPLKMATPPDRVTVEEAPVRILDPKHPLFNFPNRIEASDFEGWVQERGLYFLREWDKSYQPLLSSNDPGEEPKRGGQLLAKHGKGNYIYTGYAWFRQLPAGVPGAYRLFVNMLSLSKSGRERRAG